MNFNFTRVSKIYRSNLLFETIKTYLKQNRFNYNSALSQKTTPLYY